MRGVRVGLLMLVLLVGAAPPWTGRCAANRQPNILFMLSDDQAWNGLSVAMHPEVAGSRSESYHTPWLEKLAAQGMRFSAAYAPASVCSPTRCSLQTGKSPAQNRWTKAAPSVRVDAGYKLVPPRSRRQIADEEATIAEMLRKAGYATAHYGKWHLGGGGPGRHGYDEHDGDTGNGHAYQFVDPNPVDIFGMAERAEKFMEKNSKTGKPFFIQMSWNALHAPENALAATRKKYEQQRIGRRARAVARAAITEDLDSGVGRVMQAIDRLGIADNTYVIYMSDNGAGGRGRGGALRGGKGSVWEGGIRVPLIVRGPAVAPSSWCHTTVVGYDFFPTFCHWAGISQNDWPTGIEGGSIAPLLANGGRAQVARPRDEVVFHFPHYQTDDGPHSALRLGDLKLIRFDETGRLALFDLSKDISEQDDLIDQMPAKAESLAARLTAYLTVVGADLATPNPNYDPSRSPQSRQEARRGRGPRRQQGDARSPRNSRRRNTPRGSY